MVRGGEPQQLTESDTFFSPVVSDGAVAWMLRDTPSGNYGEIELFELDSRRVRKITNGLQPHEGFWGPSIGPRFLTWQPTRGNRIEAYDRQNGEIYLVDRGQVDGARTGGNVLAWRWVDPEAFRAFTAGESKIPPKPLVRYIVAE